MMTLTQIIAENAGFLLVLLAVLGLWVKLERRLTRIETDVKWLKQFSNPGEDDGSDR